MRDKLATGDGYLLYRLTGWECPESRFGLLAFPHAWLLSALLAASSFSLLRDARRCRTAHSLPAPPGIVLAPLLVLSLLLTLHFTLEACLGRWTRTPAPLLLIAAIGLAGGSRIWRLLTLILLGGGIVWCCYVLLQLRPVQLDTFALFDRVYDVPKRAYLAALAGTTAGMIAAIPLLARPPRVANC